MRRGGTAVSDEGTVSHDNPIWVAFARAMAPLMQMPAQLLADLVGGDTRQPLRVLDVAAGHGLFGITIAERYPQAHITALDWPNVLAVAAENARRAGVAERHALRPGSAFDVDWGGPYDIVLLTNFLHHFDVPTCEQLAAKALRGSRTGRPSPYAGIHSRTRSHHAAVDGQLRPGDARHHGPRRRLHVRGISGRFSPGPGSFAANFTLFRRRRNRRWCRIRVETASGQHPTESREMSQDKRQKRDLHALNPDGMVLCNPPR